MIFFRQIQISKAILLIAGCALFYLPSAVLADQYDAPGPEVARSVPGARSAGTTRLKVWGFEVYDAHLWTAPGFQAVDYAGHAFALELRYLRSFEGQAIAQRSIQEMQRLGSPSDAQTAQWLAQMRAIFPNVRPGDRLLGVHQPGVGAAFLFNGKPIGELRDGEFARLFFGIWLSPKTSQAQMRRELVGADAPTRP